MFRVRKQINCSDTYTGAGVTVAVLDTGIFPHPDFGKRIIGFADFVNGRVGLYDDDSHGTHVSGILCGDGRLSGGRYRGIAPGCKLVMGKVLNSNGDGSIDHMLQGMEWILHQRAEWNIRILNISVGLGLDLQEKQQSMLLEAVEEIWKQGIIVVVAAGNSGPLPGSLSPMGYSPQVITVGCNEGGYFGERSSLCEHYSGRADRPQLRKPDLVAPGTDIISCSSHARISMGSWKNGYMAKSGTSMSTPMAAGAAALYLQKCPEASGSEVRRRLVYSATDLHEPWDQQGWGMLNIGELLK